MTTAKPQLEIAATVPAAKTLKIALYAEWGRRKTEQLGRLIESVGMNNCVIVSCDQGLDTIDSVVDYDRVAVANSWDEMRDAYKFAQTKLNGNTNPWALVDGATSLLLQHVNSLFAATEEAFDYRARKESIPTQGDKSVVCGISLIEASRYLTKADQIDGMAIYGRVGRDLTRLFQTWKALGANLVFTFLEELTGLTDKREKTYPFGPAIPGNLGYRAAMSTFDYVVRLWYDAQGHLMAGTKATGIYEARTREDQRGGIEIPAVISDFDLSEFIKLIRPVKG